MSGDDNSQLLQRAASAVPKAELDARTPAWWRRVGAHHRLEAQMQGQFIGAGAPAMTLIAIHDVSGIGRSDGEQPRQHSARGQRSPSCSTARPDACSGRSSQRRLRAGDGKASQPSPAHGRQQPGLFTPGPAFPGQDCLPGRRLSAGRGAAGRRSGWIAGHTGRGDATLLGHSISGWMSLFSFPIEGRYMANADRLVLRIIGTGIGLRNGALCGLVLPMPHLGVIMAWVVLCQTREPLGLKKGWQGILLLGIMASGVLLVPLLTHYALAAVCFVGLLLYLLMQQAMAGKGPPPCCSSWAIR